nr:serine/threonine-protein phosphatase 7 long form homolog [Ipomoea batatas]
MSCNYVHPGPLDSSLLTFQVHHRSESVWANQEYKAQLSCVHYARGAFRNMRMNDRVEELLRQSGFITITCLRHMKLDHHLITALVERWRPEVHAFHMPFGEVTISLQDVEVLLELKIDGRPLIGKIEKNKGDRLVQIQTFLGFTPRDDAYSHALPICCRAGQAIWTARVPLLFFFYAVEWHYPDRVCRQFGGYQDIPSHVEYDHNLHKLDGRTKNEDWGVFHHAYVALWENRTHQLVPIGPHSPLGPYVTLAYEHWFYRVGRRLIGNPDHRQTVGYLQTAPSYISTVELISLFN